MVGMGSVVTKDVKPFQARRGIAGAAGRVGLHVRTAARGGRGGGRAVCARCGRRYAESAATVRLVGQRA